MSAHIPGPWEITSAIHGVGHRIDDSDNAPICEVHPRGKERTIANARLIAVAPDLFEACKLFISAPYPDCEEMSDAFDKAFDAVSKVEGKE